MINQPPRFEAMSGKRSTVAALFFAIVMIMGMLWIFNDPPGDKYDKTLPVAASQTEESVQTQPSYGWYIFRMIAVTGFLIILFLVGVKYYKGRMTQTGHFFNVQVLGKQYFSTKQYLMLVRVEDRKMLLGITDHSINLLKEFRIDTENDESGGDADHLEDEFRKVQKKQGK